MSPAALEALRPTLRGRPSGFVELHSGFAPPIQRDERVLRCEIPDSANDLLPYLVVIMDSTYSTYHLPIGKMEFAKVSLVNDDEILGQAVADLDHKPPPGDITIRSILVRAIRDGATDDISPYYFRALQAEWERLRNKSSSSPPASNL